MDFTHGFSGPGAYLHFYIQSMFIVIVIVCVKMPQTGESKKKKIPFGQ